MESWNSALLDPNVFNVVLQILAHSNSPNLENKKEKREAYHRGGTEPEDHHHHKVKSPARPLLWDTRRSSQEVLVIPSWPVLRVQK